MSEAVLRAAQHHDTEVRAFQFRTTGSEERADGAISFRGYASVFNRPYGVAGVFVEQIAPGAFRRSIHNARGAKRDDVPKIHMLVNHDESSIPLAALHSGTMELREDERGLYVEAELDPSSPWAQSVASAIRRGDLDEMSFAFRAVKDEWDESGDVPLRTVKELKLYEVSVVRNGANPATEATIDERQSLDDDDRTVVEPGVEPEPEAEPRKRAVLLLTRQRPC
jgi:HK97 family phage prohead protease